MWPSTLSSFTDPQPTDRLNNPSHSSIETAQNSGIERLENYIGVNTGVNASALGTLIGTVMNPASNGGGHVQTANKGGTGQTNYTKGDLLVATSQSVLSKLAVGTDGLTLITNSGTAAGVEWGTPPGTQSSVQTLFPKSDIATNVKFANALNVTSHSVMQLGLINIPNTIKASVLTILSGDAIGNSGTADVTMYRENGASSVFTLVTPTISAIYTPYRVYFPSVLQIDSGNYYVGINPNASDDDYQIVCWSSPSSIVGKIANIPGSPVPYGRYIIAGGSPPASIVTTAITSVATGAFADNLSLYFRIDG